MFISENMIFSRFNWLSFEAMSCSRLEIFVNSKFVRVTFLQEVKENIGIDENIALHLFPRD